EDQRAVRRERDGRAAGRLLTRPREAGAVGARVEERLACRAALLEREGARAEGLLRARVAARPRGAGHLHEQALEAALGGPPLLLGEGTGIARAPALPRREDPGEDDEQRDEDRELLAPGRARRPPRLLARDVGGDGRAPGVA